MDYIHMLVSIPPKYSISQIMGYLKGKSNLMILGRHTNLKYKYGDRYFRARGYDVKEIYTQHRRPPLKKQDKFYAQHASASIFCKMAKRYFNGPGLKKLPPIQSLKQEYAALLAENKKLYPYQKKAKAEMMELLTVKHNTSRILGLTEKEKKRKQRQEE